MVFQGKILGFCARLNVGEDNVSQASDGSKLREVSFFVKKKVSHTRLNRLL